MGAITVGASVSISSPGFKSLVAMIYRPNSALSEQILNAQHWFLCLRQCNF